MKEYSVGVIIFLLVSFGILALRAYMEGEMNRCSHCGKQSSNLSQRPTCPRCGYPTHRSGKGEDHLAVKPCPRCGQFHEIDYPKCPFCGYNYL